MPIAMFAADELAVVRRAYAHQVAAAAGTTNPRIEAAFAVVPREKFLGAPPWQVANLGGGYRPLLSSDLVLAYQDALFALQPDKGTTMAALRCMRGCWTNWTSRSAIASPISEPAPVIIALFWRSWWVLRVMSMPSRWIEIWLVTLKQRSPIGPMSASSLPTEINGRGKRWMRSTSISPSDVRRRPGSKGCGPVDAWCCRLACRARGGRRVAAVMHRMAQHFELSAAPVDLRRAGSVQPISSVPMVD